MSLFNHLAQPLTRRFLRGLVSTAAGRAHVLSQAADAESTDEGAIFDRLLAHVDDPKLEQMIRRHQADELRHASMFRERLTATGVDPGPVPAHLKLLERIDALADHVMQRPVDGAHDVMVSYLMLLVIEERAINQFSLFAPAFDEVDPATAAVFREVGKDEARHLRYCHAIASRYAPSEAIMQSTLAQLRACELKAFVDNSRANMDWVFEHGLHPATAFEQVLWRASMGMRLFRRVRPPLRAQPA